MQKISIAVRGGIVSWRHKSDSGVETGNALRYFYTDKPLTLDGKIEMVKRSALKFMEFSEDEVEFSITKRTFASDGRAGI